MMDDDVVVVRNELVGELNFWAGLWSMKAAKTPDDERYEVARRALEAAVDLICTLPLDDPRLAEIAACWYSPAVQDWLAKATRVIREHGFPPFRSATGDELLDRLAQLARRLPTDDQPQCACDSDTRRPIEKLTPSERQRRFDAVRRKVQTESERRNRALAEVREFMDDLGRSLGLDALDDDGREDGPVDDARQRASSRLVAAVTAAIHAGLTRDQIQQDIEWAFEPFDD
jgi:hypothetical protein